MKIIKGKEKEYKDWYDKNSDGYGRACFTYAERWAELLEAEIDKSNDVMKCFADNADRLSHEADTEGMDTVIALCVSAVGSYFCGVDFCTLYALISISIELNKYAKDKTANR